MNVSTANSFSDSTPTSTEGLLILSKDPDFESRSGPVFHNTLLYSNLFIPGVLNTIPFYPKFVVGFSFVNPFTFFICKNFQMNSSPHLLPNRSYSVLVLLVRILTRELSTL